MHHDGFLKWWPHRSAAINRRLGLFSALFLVGVLLALMVQQTVWAQSTDALKTIPPGSQPAVTILREARLESAAGTASVVLPHALQPAQFDPKGGRVRYQLTLDLPQTPKEQLAIYIQKVSLGARFFLNGELVGSCAVGALEDLRCLHRPWLIAPPPMMWKQGPNLLTVEVHADERQMNGLSTVHVGPLTVLESGPYASEHFLRQTFMQALTAITVVLGCLALMVALHLPGRSLYLWVGVASITYALSNVNFLSSVAWPTPDLFSWFAFSSRMAAMPLLALACVAFYGKDRPWQHWLALAYALGAPVLTWVTNNNRTLVSWYYVPLLLVGVLVVASMARWTWQSRKWRHVLMLGAVAALLAAGFSDWLRLRGVSAFEGVYLMAYASAGFLVIMGALVMAELAAGLNRSRELTAMLEAKVAEREQRLAQAFEERIKLERDAAVNLERERLLADMHDSLGSGLSTAYLLLQQGQLSVRGAAYLVQECMDDLRLVFDVSGNRDGQLQTLVADVRYRMDGRLMPMGFKVEWLIELDDMPALSSASSLQLMRVLQEALTNAMRHADATDIQVRLQYLPGEGALLMQVHDNGVGMTQEPRRMGRGLGNMARRATALGAELDIQSDDSGTTVQLRCKL